MRVALDDARALIQDRHVSLDADVRRYVDESIARIMEQCVQGPMRACVALKEEQARASEVRLCSLAPAFPFNAVRSLGDFPSASCGSWVCGLIFHNVAAQESALLAAKQQTCEQELAELASVSTQRAPSTAYDRPSSFLTIPGACLLSRCSSLALPRLI